MSILVFILTLSTSSLRAQDELAAQREACDQNTAMTWDAQLNRCVGKVQARQERHEAQDCNELSDVGARKSCHMNLAKSKTGVTDDPTQAGKKMSDLQSRSTIINTANTIVSAINFFAKDTTASSCVSKQIFGITSLGGFLTDIYLKIQTKKKLEGLKNKFIVENKDSAYNAQVKALEYLKEEQSVVKDIASQEKKRQMLLMIGYGSAAAFAAYETFWNTSCYKQEPKKDPSKEVKATANEAQKPAESVAQTDTKATPAPTATAAAAPETTPAPAAAPATSTPAAEAVTAPTTASSPAAEVKTESATLLKSTKNGNYQHNFLERDGQVVGVVHNGQVYEDFTTKNGVHYAKGTPSGKFDYSSGTWGSGKVSDVAVTTNYNFSNGRITSGSGETPVRNTSFGTGRK